jgi:sugar phosphate isomerase/epimerase
VKLACTSTAFSRAFENGDLTQLEFLDLCARELRTDGVVLDAAHFPRADDDYLAQMKKMATDLGLCVAAIADDGFFTFDEATMRRTIEIASATGAPLVAARLVSETASPWTDTLERIGVATRLAKQANVTLAVRNAPATFAATTHDCKRVAKEADSAWLRFCLEPAAFDTASNPLDLVAKAVLLWADDRLEPDPQSWQAFRGYLALDRPSGDATMEEMKQALLRWEGACCRTLGESVLLDRK